MTKRSLEKAIELKKELKDRNADYCYSTLDSGMSVKIVTLITQSDMNDIVKCVTLKLFLGNVLTMEEVLDDVINSSN